MAYKSLLTIISDCASVAQVLAVSTALAQREEAHLDVLCVGVQGGQSGEALGAKLGVAALELLVTTQLAEAGGRATVENVALHACGLAELVARQARFSDLVILAKPYGNHAPALAALLAEAALFRAKVPVLILPPSRSLFAVEAVALGQHVVVGWNQSAAALAAIRAALPLLRAAVHVTIAIVDPQPDSVERSDPGGALSQMLAWHGVRADVAVLGRSGLVRSRARVADVLACVLRDKAADLLVMGAEGLALRGTTRDMLELAEVPVLVAG